MFHRWCSVSSYCVLKLPTSIIGSKMSNVVTMAVIAESLICSLQYSGLKYSVNGITKLLFLRDSRNLFIHEIGCGGREKRIYVAVSGVQGGRSVQDARYKAAIPCHVATLHQNAINHRTGAASCACDGTHQCRSRWTYLLNVVVASLFREERINDHRTRPKLRQLETSICPLRQTSLRHAAVRTTR